MEITIKRVAYWIWYIPHLMLFLIVLIYALLGLVLQLPIGITSYLCNWEEDRKLENEIKSANILNF